MKPLVVFVLQFFWFLLAWSLIVYFVIWPWSARFSPDTRLSAWVAPEMFRVLGLGLLVPNLRARYGIRPYFFIAASMRSTGIA